MDTNTAVHIGHTAEVLEECFKWLTSYETVENDTVADEISRCAMECRNAGRLMDDMEKALRGAADALVEAGRSFANSNPLASRPNLFELHATAVREVLQRVTPSVPAVGHAPAVKCDNCNWTGTADQTRPARDLWKRMDAGGPVPAGECPECGCFAYTTCMAHMEVKR